MSYYAVYSPTGRLYYAGSTVGEGKDVLGGAPADAAVIFSDDAIGADYYVDLTVTPPVARSRVDSGIELQNGTLVGLPSSGVLTAVVPFFQTYNVPAGDIELDVDEPGRYVLSIQFDDPQYLDWEGEGAVT